jgi:hypothetical protein
MAIEALYRSYFQKSKIFLYPLLDIKRGASVVPEQTYVSWDTAITTEDAKLIAHYPKRTDKEYLNFEKNVLLRHSRTSDFIEIDDSNLIVTFDFSDIRDVFDNFVIGKYSQIDLKVKRKIRDFFEPNSPNYVYVDSYLFPDKYFKLYADLLAAEEQLLREVGELCSKPDLEKENLTLSVSDLQNKKILG